MAFDFYVNASLWEGLPIAHLEAMAAGLPMVVTAVGDVPLVVVEGTGLTVPPQNRNELASSILSLLSDPTRRISMEKFLHDNLLFKTIALRCGLKKSSIFIDK